MGRGPGTAAAFEGSEVVASHVRARPAACTARHGGAVGPPGAGARRQGRETHGALHRGGRRPGPGES